MAFVAFCLLRNRHNLLFIFIGIAIGTEVVTARVFSSINGLQVIGMLFMPIAMYSYFKYVSKTKAGILIGADFLLLLFMGLLYGYLFPWPDLTGSRPWTQQAQGRSLIYVSRSLIDLSFVVYVAQQVQKPGNISKLLRCLL